MTNIKLLPVVTEATITRFYEEGEKVGLLNYLHEADKRLMEENLTLAVWLTSILRNYDAATAGAAMSTVAGLYQLLCLQGEVDLQNAN